MQAIKRMMGLVLGAGMGIALALPATAAEFDALRAKHEQMGAAISAGKPPYDGMSRQARAALLEKQAALLKLMDGKNGPDEFDPQQRAQFDASLQQIDAAIARAADERQVCEFRKTLGSNRKERVCTTAGQQRQQREAARRELESRELR